MGFEKVQEFYEKLLDSENMKSLEEKLKNITDEKSYRDFICTEILPQAEEMGYDFDIDDITAYDKKFLQSLSEEELASVTGGSIKNIPGVGGLFALLFMMSGGAASAIGGQHEAVLTEQVETVRTGVVRQRGDEVSEVVGISDENESSSLIQREEQEGQSVRTRQRLTVDDRVSSHEGELGVTEFTEEKKDNDRVSVSDRVDDTDSASETDVEGVEDLVLSVEDTMHSEKDLVRDASKGRAEKLRADFIGLYRENKELVEKIKSLESANPYSSEIEEILDIEKYCTVEEISRNLSLGYLSSKIFNRVQFLRGEKKLSLSKVITIVDPVTECEVSASDIFELYSTEDLSQFETVCKGISSKNIELRKILDGREERAKLLQDKVEKFGFHTVEELRTRWNAAYSATDRIKMFLSGSDMVILMQAVDRAKARQLHPGLMNGHFLWLEDNVFLSQLSLQDVKNATAVFLTASRFLPEGSKDLPIIINEFIDNTWYEQACEHLQKQYSSLKIKLLAATERLRSLYSSKCIGLEGKVAVVGDIHGFYKDLQRMILELQRQLKNHEIDHVLFLGDVIDRGTSSFFTLDLLLNFFLSNTGNVHILRGNHESLYKRCCIQAPAVGKAGIFAWEQDAAFAQETGLRQNLKEFIQYEQELPVSAVINDEVLAVHGGIPIPSVENVGKFFNGHKLDAECELWSDFSRDLVELSGRVNSSRGGIGILYGPNTLRRFFTIANTFTLFGRVLRLQHIVRAHEHNIGPFDQVDQDGITATTVISSSSFIDLHRKEKLKNPASMPDRNRNHASVVLVEKGKVPREYFGISRNRLEPGGLVLVENAFARSGIEILDLMYPLAEVMLQDNAFVGSNIRRIILHDQMSRAWLEKNRAKYGIAPDTVIECREVGPIGISGLGI